MLQLYLYKPNTFVAMLYSMASTEDFRLTLTLTKDIVLEKVNLTFAVIGYAGVDG